MRPLRPRPPRPARPARLARLAATCAVAATLAGCFGYTRSARSWAYVGDALLVAGGGATIAVGVAGAPAAPPAMAGELPRYQPPLAGPVAAGAFLIAAGVAGLALNATRPLARRPSR